MMVGIVLIRSIGLFWNETDVFWGAGSQPGKLLGVPEDKITSTPVDFREQVGVYVLYADFELVYVGQTGMGKQRLLRRLRQHRKDDLSGRWNKFSWFGVRWVKKNNKLSTIAKASHPSLDAVLNHIEAIVIHTAEPPLNRQGGRFGDNVIWYSQVRDERLGRTDSEMIKALYERIEGNDETS